MGKFVFTIIFMLLPHFAFAANMCVRLFTDTKPQKYDFTQVDSTNMTSVDYLKLQHRKWQIRTGIEFYTKEQLHELVKMAKNGDRQALENLTISNIPYVIREVAKRVSRNNPIFPELVNESLANIHSLVQRFRFEAENASFLQALYWVVQDVLKVNRRNAEVIDYTIEFYNNNKNSKFDIVRESSDIKSGFSLESIKSSSIVTPSQLVDVRSGIKVIDQIKSELRAQVKNEKSLKNNPDLIKERENQRVQVFELFYGLTKAGNLSYAEIANLLGLTVRNVKWILDERIKPTVLNITKNTEIDRESLEQAFMAYSDRKSEQNINKNTTANINPVQRSAKELQSQLDQLHKEFLESKSPLETVRELSKIEAEILKSKNSDLIFELHYFMAEILLEAKKYDLAAQKAEELLKIGQNWNENHHFYSMLHHIAGKSAYHTGHYEVSHKHMTRSLVVKGAPYERWFYFAKSTEKLNSSTNFETSLQNLILYITTLRRLFRENHHTLSAKQLDELKTIEHLSEMGFKEASRILKNTHGFNSIITIEAIRNYTESKQKNDHIGIIKALQPLFEALYQTPKKRLQKLNLEGPTKKAFEVLLIDLAKSFKARGQIQQHEKVVSFLKEL